MSAKHHHLRSAALLCLAACTAFGGVADEYTLDWYTVDGGGDLWGAAGNFTLSGSVGQPDAGVVMTGANFKLTAGFWAITAVPSVCVGDLNCDGQIDFGDINPFVQYLSDYPAWQVTYAGCNPRNGDINGDGTYGGASFGDINPFVALLTSAPTPCP